MIEVYWAVGPFSATRMGRLLYQSIPEGFWINSLPDSAIRKDGDTIEAGSYNVISCHFNS
jgi:hypothetical protein